MPEQARSFEAPAKRHEEPPKKKSADILPFIRKGVVEKKKGENNFDTYRSLGGHLSQAEYDAVTAIDAREAKVNDMYTMHARRDAGVAGVILSDEVVRLYALLRDDKTSDVPDKLARMSDQVLLAEVLRFKGNGDDIETMKTKLPHIDF